MKDGKPQSSTDAPDDGRAQIDIEAVIEQIWRDMNGTASRSEIRSVLAEIAPRYDGVRITTFVPIFLQREVRRHLQSAPAFAQAVGTSGTSGASGKDADTVREDAAESAGFVNSGLEPASNI
jgi:hypothetical protein